jgi:threonine dehydratase
VVCVFDIYNKREDLIDVISYKISSFFSVINALTERDNRNNEIAVLL